MASVEQFKQNVTDDRQTDRPRHTEMDRYRWNRLCLKGESNSKADSTHFTTP